MIGPLIDRFSMHLRKCQRNIQKMACSLCDCQSLQLLSDITGHVFSSGRKYIHLKDSDQGCFLWKVLKTFLPQVSPLLPCLSMSALVPLQGLPSTQDSWILTPLVLD